MDHYTKSIHVSQYLDLLKNGDKYFMMEDYNPGDNSSSQVMLYMNREDITIKYLNDAKEHGEYFIVHKDLSINMVSAEGRTFDSGIQK